MVARDSGARLVHNAVTMKELLLLRHAKSSWKAQELDDHDRPLSKRGKQDADRMGRLLRGAGVVPDRVISSTALRARTTAAAVAEAGAFPRGPELSPKLYLSEVEGHLELLRELDDACPSVLLVGHNPALEELLRTLTGAEAALPTGALACVQLPVDRWSELQSGVRGCLRDLWRPKRLPQDASG
jgi:phosphohistidine phosphatase